MALLACHMMKFKQADLKGMEIHNDRKSLHSSNKDIDYSRTSTNFDALTGTEGNPQINYPKIAKAIIEKKYTGTRAIRNDAVYAVGFIVTAKNEFFANMSNDDQKRFFKVASDYLSEKFGSDNVIAAKVHRDEATPHMHFSFVPIKDGKLTAKTIVDRKALKEVQDDLPKKLRAAGFEIERGVVESENEHVDPSQYKRNLALAQKEIAYFKSKTNEVEDHAKSVEIGWLDKKEVAQLPVEDYYYLVRLAKDYEALRLENAKLQLSQSHNVKTLRKENEALKEELLSLHKQLEKANSKLDDQAQKINHYNLLKKYVPKELEKVGMLACHYQREERQRQREENDMGRTISTTHRKTKSNDGYQID